MGEALLTPLRDVVFRDLDLAFVAHPVTRKLSIVENEEAIKSAVKNLVFTNRYDRLFKPLLYSDVISMLFEHYDPVTVTLLKERIKNVIRSYEPRANLIDVHVHPDFDTNNLEIKIVFEALNRKEPVEVLLFLERIR